MECNGLLPAQGSTLTRLEQDNRGHLHIEPGNCVLGVGTWRPDSTALSKIMDAITISPKLLATVTCPHPTGVTGSILGNCILMIF